MNVLLLTALVLIPFLSSANAQQSKRRVVLTGIQIREAERTVGTIVLVYDKVSFVSAKEWVKNPKLKDAALANGALQ